MELNPNPLVKLILVFQDGTGLPVIFRNPVPQALVMQWVGEFARRTGQPSFELGPPEPSR